jgi:nucleotide-binding universal stress UspA family protein
VELCQAPEATLTVISVAPSFEMPLVGQFFPEGYEDSVKDALHEALSTFIRTHIPRDLKVRTIVRVGTVYREILEAADHINADLIVIAAGRPELRDYLIGPNAARVVRHAACSVLVVRN